MDQTDCNNLNGEISLNCSEDEEFVDPFCNPSTPAQLRFQDVSLAALRIKDAIIKTPCIIFCSIREGELRERLAVVFCKFVPSFKERGARYALMNLTQEQRTAGVIAASAGNHALALSYHGQNLSIPVTVVMPVNAPLMKINCCRSYGAEIIMEGKDIAESRKKAFRLSRETGKIYINGYDHPHILAGAGTMALEIMEQVDKLDAVIIPVGGGGLITGMATVFKALCPHVLIIGVESCSCPSFTEALRAGKPVPVDNVSSLADGLAVPMVGFNAFASASTLVDRTVCVTEEHIAMAILRLVENEKAVIEGAGAVGLAALLGGYLDDMMGKRVAIPLTGGNIDTTLLGRCLERGLAVDGRLVKFKVTVSDRPGGIYELTKLLQELGVSIKDMFHERAWLKNDLFSTDVKIICETSDFDHASQLKKVLEKHYAKVNFVMHS